MKKKILSVILTLMVIFTFSGCGSTPSSQQPTSTENQATDEVLKGCTINIASLKGPTSIGLVKLFYDSDNKESFNSYNYSIYGAADEITAGLIKGSLDVAAIPCNLASVLYNKTESDIVIAAVNTLGVLYILQKNESIASVEDLKGKTIYTTGQGTTPEYTLRYLLRSSGIDPDNDVTIEFCSEASEVVSTVSTLDSAVMMLPQPYVTVALNSDSSISVALDATEEWEKINNQSTIVTGVLVARKAFIEEQSEAFAAFLEEYKTSTDFANNNIEECAALLESFDIFKAAIAVKAIPECNVTFITGDEMQTKVLAYLNALYEEAPASIGGAIPEQDIFYTQK